MPSRLVRAACLALALTAPAVAARAGDLADFNAAMETVSAHNRVAIGYLRTGNADLASLELDRLRAAWSKVGERFAGKRPDPFDGNPRYVTAFTDIAMRLITADMMLNSNRPDNARDALIAVRDDLYDLRKSAGIVVLADCVRDSNTAMDALMVYNDRALDWSKSDTRYDIAAKAAIYGHEVARCDGMASQAVRKDADFRRLVDGVKASLTNIPKAIAERDTGLLHRVLIELRAFDNLLAFRFG
ncbi:MAG TPA: hypothetical protein VG986_19660 [Pseudolabrys sp.]|nr:hypothetical protein [Pseudolabrys sp.]